MYERLGEVGVAGRAGADLVLLADQSAQGDLLLTREPAELSRVAAKLGAATLHQAEHLQHPVVHGARQPGPLSGSGRVALGAVAVCRHPLQ